MSLFFRPLLHRIFSVASVSSSRYFSDVASKPTSSAASPTAALADPLASPDYFGFRDYLSLEQLFKARVHLGHRSMLRNPYMTPYLFGCRQGIDIIDLDQTLELLFAALNFTAHIAYRGGIILFMTQHKQMMPLVEQTARAVGEYSYCRPWGGGVFTDSSKFFKSTAVRLPDLVIMLNTLTPFGAPHVAVRDAAKMLIPTVAVVDSNCDPRLVTYPIPGNDDSPTAVRLYCSLFAEAVSHGKRRARRDATLRQQLKERQTVA
ncbi:28S ribosomal protein S2, mitochondrial [Sparganum proliferum]